MGLNAPCSSCDVVAAALREIRQALVLSTSIRAKRKTGPGGTGPASGAGARASLGHFPGQSVERSEDGAIFRASASTSRARRHDPGPERRAGMGRALFLEGLHA